MARRSAENDSAASENGPPIAENDEFRGGRRKPGHAGGSLAAWYAKRGQSSARS